jgi:hypothetical protein
MLDLPSRAFFDEQLSTISGIAFIMTGCYRNLNQETESSLCSARLILRRFSQPSVIAAAKPCVKAASMSAADASSARAAPSSWISARAHGRRPAASRSCGQSLRTSHLLNPLLQRRFFVRSRQRLFRHHPFRPRLIRRAIRTLASSEIPCPEPLPLTIRTSSLSATLFPPLSHFGTSRQDRSRSRPDQVSLHRRQPQPRRSIKDLRPASFPGLAISSRAPGTRSKSKKKAVGAGGLFLAWAQSCLALP